MKRRRRSGSSEGGASQRRRRRGGGTQGGSDGSPRAPRKRRSSRAAAAAAPEPSAAPDPSESPESAETQTIRVVDPTHELLSRVRPPESRVPWTLVGLAVVVALWIPIFANLGTAPERPAEARWVEDALAPAGEHSAGSAFALALTRTAWRLQGADVSARLDTPGARRTVRIPFAVAGLAATAIFFVLARLMVGSAAAVLAVALLAASEPWARAGASAWPLVIGEMMVLLGVVWAMALQARHREVGVAGITASRLGIAGIFLGLGILLTPAAFATFVATIMVWLLVGIRRSRADATTLQVGSPRRLVAAALVGSVLFLAASLAAVYVAERLAGGTGFPAMIPDGDALARGFKLWSELYGTLLSPGPSTDILLVVALSSILLIRFAEWQGGRPWHAAGLAPWVVLGLWVLALQHDGSFAAAAAAVPADPLDAAPRLDVPVTLPPLFVLGLGWLVLRGLHPGEFRRQEYTFLLAWLGVSLMMVPFVPGSHPHAAQLASAVTLLPPMLLLVGRAGRVMWEAKPHALARAGIVVFVLAPVAWSAAMNSAEAMGVDAARSLAHVGRRALPIVLLASVALGVIAELISVRPDPAGPAPRPRGEGGARRRRRGGGRRAGGRGPRGGSRGSSRSGGRGRRQAA